VVAIGLIWGSAFLWIAIGLDSLAPGVVAWLRVTLGAGALFVLSGARKRIDRADWTAVAIVAVAGNAGPALLFALAEQTLDSAVAGMISSATPVFTLIIALALGNRSVGPGHVLGLVAGFGGVMLMASPSFGGEDASLVGVVYALLAVFGYGLTGNVIVPLQQRYGALPVVAHAQALAVLVLAPFGVHGLSSSEFSWGPVLAVVVLGVVGTGVGRVLSATLMGRAGAQRGSVATYFVPLVAIVLGVVVRDESVFAIQLVGLVVVLAAAVVVSRPPRPEG
jgi:drug/metabolite transporter (DMT)-like permease